MTQIDPFDFYSAPGGPSTLLFHGTMSGLGVPDRDQRGAALRGARTPRPHDGSRFHKKRRFKTVEEAVKWRNTVLGEAADGSAIGPSELTLRTAIESTST
ncbi:MAG: hypothetical protein ABSD32_02900, partial [Mycobacterium sp.]